MFPNYFTGFFNDSGVPLPVIPFAWNNYIDHDLPDEVKAALEERQHEIKSEADLRRITDEEMLRR